MLIHRHLLFLLLWLNLFGWTASKEHTLEVRMDPEVDITFKGGRDYNYVCVRAPLPTDAAYHATEYEIFQEAHVHHMILYAISKNSTSIFNNASAPDVYLECNDPSWIDETAVPIFSTPSVMTHYKYPPDVGLPLGKQSQWSYVLLQMHYHKYAHGEGHPHQHNQVREKDKEVEDDDSGTIKGDTNGYLITLTSELRPRYAGLLVTGLVEQEMLIPPLHNFFVVSGSVVNAPYAEHPHQKDFFDTLFQTPNQAVAKAGGAIELIGGMGHTHGNGRLVEAYLWKNGTAPGFRDFTEEYQEYWKTKWNFDMPPPKFDAAPLGKPVLVDRTESPMELDHISDLSAWIETGDSISISCVYDTMKQKVPISGGYSSNEEMCWYFFVTAMDSPNCAAGCSFLLVDFYRNYNGCDWINPFQVFPFV